MESCEGCRKMVALCRENGISGEQMERRELDGLKKIRQITKYRGIACCGLVIFILGYMGIIICSNSGFLSSAAVKMLFITCICLVLLSGMGFKGKKRLGWLEVILGVVPIAAALYILMLILYLIEELRDGADYVFGREIYKTGPFLSLQMGLVLFAVLGLFIYHLVCIIRQDKNCNWLLCLDVAGCYSVWEYFSFLSNMVDPQKMMHLLGGKAAVVVVFGLLGIVASVLIGKVSRRKMQSSMESGSGKE